MTTYSRVMVIGIAATMILPACRPSNNETASTGQAGSSARADTAGGMAGMPGMHGMMGAGMMDSMQTHMRMMDEMTADQIKAMLPKHRQMAANMLSRMNRDMRSMNMPGDQAWNATVDSIRQDLTRMPELSGQELKATMPAHHARMTRLMQMHRDMMGRMKS
jgi:hypothetical protein